MATPRVSTAAEPTDTDEQAARALRRLLRGGTWEGLATEIAWEAVRASGVERRSLEWLPGLVERRLSELVDGIEFRLGRAREAGRIEHLRRWPSDLAGAETAASIAAGEEAERVVSALYLDVLQWATELLDDRLERPPRSLRPRLPSLRRERQPTELEVPVFVADGLTRERRRYGWPDEAGEPPRSQAA